MNYLDTIFDLKGNMIAKKQLYVIGHSLDETDKDIITEVFEIADEITVYYYDNNNSNHDLKKLVTNLINIYAKAGFDKLRNEKGLRFLPISSLNS